MEEDTIFISVDDSGCSMPWDEKNGWRPTRALQLLEEDVENGNSIDGNLSSQWRRIGEDWRKFLLEEDRRNGGTSFDLNPTCNVNRYFQVARRALEQFHRMYQEGGDLEETYIMGNRMVCFLTECLPNHPGFRRPAVAELRRTSRIDLQTLRECLDDLALRIDEEQCDKFAEEFDPVVPDEDDSEDGDEMSASSGNGWVAFEENTHGKREVVSPTNTIATTGTNSVEVIEYASSDDSMPERKIDFSDYEESSASRSMYSCTIELGTEFLEKIAREEVEYESDSEAADSWAQGDDAESFAPSYCSAQGITCDPARRVFRDMKSRVPKGNLLSPVKGEDLDQSTSSRDEMSPKRQDPPAEISRLPSREGREYPEGFHSPPKTPNRHSGDVRAQEGWGYPEGFHSPPKTPNRNTDDVRASAVVSEIQRFLDASFEYDPSRVFDSSMERFSRVSTSKSFSTETYRRTNGSRRSRDPFALVENDNSSFSVDDLESQGWVSFDASLGPSRNFRAPDFYGRVHTHTM